MAPQFLNAAVIALHMTLKCKHGPSMVRWASWFRRVDGCTALYSLISSSGTSPHSRLRHFMCRQEKHFTCRQEKHIMCRQQKPFMCIQEKHLLCAKEKQLTEVLHEHLDVELQHIHTTQHVHYLLLQRFIAGQTLLLRHLQQEMLLRTGHKTVELSVELIRSCLCRRLSAQMASGGVPSC